MLSELREITERVKAHDYVIIGRRLGDLRGTQYLGWTGYDVSILKSVCKGIAAFYPKCVPIS